MIRILITGKTGQVGWELERALCPLGEVVAVDRRQLDLSSPKAIRDEVRRLKPHIVVNAAAYTAVDRAESESQVAMTINASAPAVLADEARSCGAFLVHYSSDYVFDGLKPTPYLERDPTNPLGAYGRSKLAGEQAIATAGVPHLIFRTSWVYSARGHNFVRTILQRATEAAEVRVVDEQVGAPTWARGLAEMTALVLAKAVSARSVNYDYLHERSGLYHLTAAGAVSWFGFANAILAHAEKYAGKRRVSLTPIATAEYPAAASRPPNSRLDNAKFAAAFGLVLPEWEIMLDLCVREMTLSR